MNFSRNLCLILALLGFGSLGAMEPEHKQIDHEALVSLAKTNQDTVMIARRFLSYQGSLFDLLNGFVQGKISKEECLKRVQDLDRNLLLLLGKFPQCPASLKKFIQPVYGYALRLFKHAKMEKGQLAVTIDWATREEFNKKFLSEYQSIQEACYSLFTQINAIMNDLSLPQPAQPQTEGTARKNSYLITKEEFGCTTYSDTMFLTYLRNLCALLEDQQLAAETIDLRGYILTKALDAINNYYETLANSHCYETVSAEDFPLRGSASLILHSDEAYFAAYRLSHSIKDHQAFDLLEKEALELLPTSNEEIKSIASCALAKNKLDRSLAYYNQLVRIYLKLSAFQDERIINSLQKRYDLYLESTDANCKKQLEFFPNALFNFQKEMEKAIKIYNDAKTLKEGKNGITAMLAIIEKFKEEFTAKQSSYAANYKRLKLSILNLSKKSSIQLDADQNYLTEYSFAPFTLDALAKKNAIIDAQDYAFIKMMRKEKQMNAPVKTAAIDMVAPAKISPKLSPASIKRKEKAKQKKNTKNENMAKPANTEPIHEEMHGPVVEKTESQKENICLGTRKIAKRIKDHSGATIVVYRLKDENQARPSNHFNYHDRVEQWFKNPAKALEAKAFADSDPRKKVSIPFHAFSKEVDKYALKWGFRKTGQSKFGKDKVELHLPGIIEHNGTRHEGLFVYVIDSKYLCYHRFFHVCDWHKTLADEWDVTIDNEMEMK